MSVLVNTLAAVTNGCFEFQWHHTELIFHTHSGTQAPFICGSVSRGVQLLSQIVPVPPTNGGVRERWGRHNVPNHGVSQYCQIRIR